MSESNQRVIRRLLGTMMSAACVLALVFGLESCKSCGGGSRERQADETAKLTTLTPKMKFNTDSAYNYIAQQIAFGPRVPGTPAHEACAQYLVDKLHELKADSVWTQKCTATAFNGDHLPLTNIMARYNGNGSDRILLIAHYDTRPWADRERSPELANTPVLGANDGASGVAVILELARAIGQQRPEVGVDIFLTDGEDYGNSTGWGNSDSTWCLGTQYWVKHLPADYNHVLPRYGILLDMVGGNSAQFHREYISELYASPVLDKVWSIADRSGFASHFVNRQGGSVVDDHLYINQTGIPTIDIIDVNNEATGNFPETWHTASDNLDGISKNTLGAVGQTVSNVIYYEKSH